MTESTRALVDLSAALSAGSREGLADAIDRAAAADPVGAEEVLLQSYLFLGYPAALNAFKVWRERTGRAAPTPTEDDWAGWRVRGEQVCARVYGGQYERLRGNVAARHPDM